MKNYSELYQSADWKKEKHVPVIETGEKVKKGEDIEVLVSVGKEIPHPNTTAHHIRWIEVYFLPEGEKAAIQLARAEFSSHGESSKGPDTGGVLSLPVAALKFKTERPGELFASSYCNIHGLWQNSREIKF